MEMKGEYPALSRAGVPANHREIASQQFLIPFASNHSQSNFYAGAIESIAYEWQQTGGEMNRFPEAVASMYERLFLKYFETCTVTVERIPSSPRAFTLKVEYGDGSTTATISDSIFADNSALVLSNYGVTVTI